MLLLLLLEVDNTTIFLMASLNTIDGKNRWSLFAATFLSLLLAINNSLIRLVVMAWHPQHDLASRTFGNTLVEDKTIGWYCHIAGSSSLASASTACLVNYCCVAAYAEWAVARTLRWRDSALLVRQVPFRVHRSAMPIAWSPIRLIVVRSSTPSLTRRLSCGT